MLGILISMGILALFLAGVLHSIDASASFYQQQPHRYVSDEEFLAAMPDVPEHVALGVRQVLADVLLIDPHSIHPADRLIDDLGFE